MHKFEITNAEGGAALPVQLNLGADENKVIGKDQEVVFIDLKAGEDQEEIEEMLSAFLCKKLRIGPGKVAIASGKSYEKKVIIIMGLTPHDIERRLFA
jgi:uncharacterized protein YggU (UPF0235/DUF167 family)